MLDYEKTARTITRDCMNYIRNTHRMPSSFGVSKQEYKHVQAARENGYRFSVKYRGRELQIPIEISTVWVNKKRVS